MLRLSALMRQILLFFWLFCFCHAKYLLFMIIFIVVAVIVCLPQLRIRIPMSPWGDTQLSVHQQTQSSTRTISLFSFSSSPATFLRTDCVWFSWLSSELTCCITVPDSRQQAFQLSIAQLRSAADFLFAILFWRFVFIILLWYRPWADSYTQQCCRSECNKKKMRKKIW